jgi:hypothetical protein
MPFDGSLLSLEAKARAVGLEPIPLATLESYKAEQCKLHRGSWLYTIAKSRNWINIVGKISCFMIFGGGFLALGLCNGVISALAILGGLAVFIGGVAVSFIKVKGPAKWQEKVADLSSLPTQVERAIKKLEDIAPNNYYIIGELYQDKVMLDPYLLAADPITKEGICLAIWDDDKIIASALPNA